MHCAARPMKQLLQLFFGNRKKKITDQLQKSAHTQKTMQTIEDINEYNEYLNQELYIAPARQAQINEVRYIPFICACDMYIVYATYMSFITNAFSMHGICIINAYTTGMAETIAVDHALLPSVTL